MFGAVLLVFGTVSASVLSSRGPESGAVQGNVPAGAGGLDSDDSSMAGITATTCAELVDQLLERDGIVELMSCEDEGADSYPPTTLSPEEWSERMANYWEPVELGSRLTDGRKACEPGAQRVVVYTTTPSLSAEYLNDFGFGFKFEYRPLGASQSTIVVSTSPLLTAEVAAGKTYQWRVRAVQQTGWSTWCEFTVRG